MKSYSRLGGEDTGSWWGFLCLPTPLRLKHQTLLHSNPRNHRLSISSRRAEESHNMIAALWPIWLPNSLFLVLSEVVKWHLLRMFPAKLELSQSLRRVVRPRDTSTVTLGCFTGLDRQVLGQCCGSRHLTACELERAAALGIPGY